eukprot:4239386-Alexandrium_andersonii.AAC.1
MPTPAVPLSRWPPNLRWPGGQKLVVTGLQSTCCFQPHDEEVLRFVRFAAATSLTLLESCPQPACGARVLVSGSLQPVVLAPDQCADVRACKGWLALRCGARARSLASPHVVGLLVVLDSTMRHAIGSGSRRSTKVVFAAQVPSARK